MKIKFKTLLIIISLLGILSTMYLTYAHYFGSNICDVSNFISCDRVNISEYSTIFNIPLSILGVIYFLISLILIINDKIKLAGYLSVPVLIYSLYLTYVEFFIIKALCLVCEFTKILMILILIFAFTNSYKSKNNTSEYN